jgi:hypothetical protein
VREDRTTKPPASSWPSSPWTKPPQRRNAPDFETYRCGGPFPARKPSAPFADHSLTIVATQQDITVVFSCLSFNGCAMGPLAAHPMFSAYLEIIVADRLPFNESPVGERLMRAALAHGSAL